MKYAFGGGVVLLAIIATLLEYEILIHDPWQLLNPFRQILVFLKFFSAPIVWILFPLTLLFGYLATKQS